MRVIKIFTIIVVFILQGISPGIVSGQTASAGLVPQFKIANVLQSDMVVQQGKPLRIWGTAPTGDKITISADWTNKTITVQANEQGEWIGQINVPAAKRGNFDPHIITISNKYETVKLSDVLIGDVWFCAGQSNMDMILQKIAGWYPGVLNWEQEVAAANFPAIRMYKTSAEFKISPVTDTKGKWVICSPKTAGNFSAVGYFFGREIYQKLNIPVGLVVCAAAGASCQAFTKKEILEGDTAFKHKYLDPRKDFISSQRGVDTIGFFGKVTAPVLLYNGMIHPLINLSIRGYTWYQGESNIPDKGMYTKLCAAMINSWRKDFRQGDLPFYFTQIAPCLGSKKDSLATDAAFFREAQENLLHVKNTGMAVTLDVGEPLNVHPHDKKSVGVRLALNALYKTYNLKNTVYLGPHYKSFEIQGNKVKVNFEPQSIGSGLTTKDGQEPRYFYLAGDDHIFYKANAVVVDNQVWLQTDKVMKPVAVRYAFTDAPITNLSNKEGLPAMAFRTDNWDK